MNFEAFDPSALSLPIGNIFTALVVAGVIGLIVRVAFWVARGGR